MRMNLGRWIALSTVIIVLGMFGCFALVLVAWRFEIKPTLNRPVTYAIKFGVIETDASGEQHLARETTTIPLKYKASGFLFGVQIDASDKRDFSYHFVFHYPTPPKVITGGNYTDDKPSTTMQTDEEQGQGSTLDYNWFDPGDPVGDQSVDVYINGKLVKTIKYTVVEEK